MTRIEFQQIIKHYYKGEREVLCKNPRPLPSPYTFDDLKNDALRYGYNYSFDKDKALIIKLSPRQENEIKNLP